MESTFSPIEISDIAKNQRGIIFAILINILCTVVMFLGLIPQEAVAVINLAIVICIAVFLVKLRSAMKKNVVLTVLSVICLLIPLLSLLILLVNNSYANNILKNAGLKVGLMGVSEDNLKKFMDTSNTAE